MRLLVGYRVPVPVRCSLVATRVQVADKAGKNVRMVGYCTALGWLLHTPNTSSVCGGEGCCDVLVFQVHLCWLAACGAALW